MHLKDYAICTKAGLESSSKLRKKDFVLHVFSTLMMISKKIRYKEFQRIKVAAGLDKKASKPLDNVTSLLSTKIVSWKNTSEDVKEDFNRKLSDEVINKYLKHHPKL